VGRTDKKPAEGVDVEVYRSGADSLFGRTARTQRCDGQRCFSQNSRLATVYRASIAPAMATT
jgi:hypothetical protein